MTPPDVLPQPFPFTKMSGTGNDFILFDNREEAVPRAMLSQLARTICHRGFSIGADGLIAIGPSVSCDFSWDFYNSDGSAAEMCGNGARCAARFAFEKKIAPRKMVFETIAGPINAQLLENGIDVAVTLTRPTDLAMGRTVAMEDNTSFVVHSVNTGVPHAVVFVDAVGETPVRQWGRSLRFHQTFQPAGTNVNFVQDAGNNQLFVRTYERGVEDETMACGTGAVAAAVCAMAAGRCHSPVSVTTSGGDTLTVICRFADGPLPEAVLLQGPAHLIYEGLLNTLEIDFNVPVHREG